MEKRRATQLVLELLMQGMSIDLAEAAVEAMTGFIVMISIGHDGDFIIEIY